MSAQKILQVLVPTLYEDDHLLAIEKPSGVDMGGLDDDKKRGLIDWIVQIRKGNEKLEPVNRLSRYESGVLLLGKDAATTNRLRTLRRKGGLEQVYLAVVRGKMKQPTHMIGRPEPALSKTKSTAKPRPTKRRNVQPPPTRATILTREIQGTNRTLLNCRTFVETTHELRAQLRSARLKLLGDPLNEKSARPIRQSQTCLHLTRITLHERGQKKPLIISSRPPESFKAIVAGQKDLIRPLRAALSRRLPLLLESSSHAYRLLSGDVENAPGLVAERYGPLLILQIHNEQRWPKKNLETVARWYQKVLGLESVYTKIFARDRQSDAQSSTQASVNAKLLLGSSQPPELTIREFGVQFQIRPYDGFAVGLFLAHRDSRSAIRKLADGLEVLNLFAYTCGFSVVAAAGRAVRTVSVDLANKHLEWGKRNFELNHLPTEGHEFIVDDAFNYLRRAEKKNESFDLIVLDPPTFSHARKRGRDFSISRDLSSLIAAALGVLKPKGILLISTNYRRMSWQGLKTRIRSAAGTRKFKIMKTLPLPLDFATDPDHAKTILVKFSG